MLGWGAGMPAVNVGGEGEREGSEGFCVLAVVDVVAVVVLLFLVVVVGMR